ncbi:MAG: Fic family protein [Proteobacteria bacterium]|nr:Fic family protein [Pseudomonadota bacterium]
MSFAFLYIHPMADGNSRISRLLNNFVPRRDCAAPLPAQFILPVPATIPSSVSDRRSCDKRPRVALPPADALIRRRLAIRSCTHLRRGRALQPGVRRLPQCAARPAPSRHDGPRRILRRRGAGHHRTGDAQGGDLHAQTSRHTPAGRGSDRRPRRGHRSHDPIRARQLF